MVRSQVSTLKERRGPTLRGRSRRLRRHGDDGASMAAADARALAARVRLFANANASANAEQESEGAGSVRRLERGEGQA